MKRNILFFAVFTLSSLHASAQVPGFLGRRFSIQADAFLNLAFSNSTSVDYPNPGPVKGLNTRWNGSFNFVTGRSTAIGLNFHYLNTAFQSSYSVPLGAARDHTLNAYFFGVNFKKFFGRNLAPVGPYLKVEAGGVFLRSIIYKEGSPQSDQPHLGVAEGGTFYFQFSLGRQHVFAKRIMLDYGVQFGLTGIEAFLGFGGYDDPGLINYGEIDREARRRLFHHNIVNLYIGTGVIF